MSELVFPTAQDYLNYDFDDNFCFFAEELKAFMESIEKVDPGASMFIDFEQKFAEIIFELYDRYDALIINVEEERFYC